MRRPRYRSPGRRSPCYEACRGGSPPPRWRPRGQPRPRCRSRTPRNPRTGGSEGCSPRGSGRRKGTGPSCLSGRPLRRRSAPSRRSRERSAAARPRSGRGARAPTTVAASRPSPTACRRGTGWGENWSRERQPLGLEVDERGERPQVLVGVGDAPGAHARVRGGRARLPVFQRLLTGRYLGVERRHLGL